MKSRYHLLSNGLFPETLPPCFVARDSKRAFRGLVSKLDKSKFHEKKTSYVRYNSTKHDGNRRSFGTPNIITYFHISSFIYKNWRKFEENFSLSNLSSGRPQVLPEESDRSIKVPSLSELSRLTSAKLKYSPYVLKADIAQCFHSIYTHSIPWAAHGIAQSKSDTNKSSKDNFFNELDYFVRNGQQGNTRGVLVGPDAYRIIAEFILSKMDEELISLVGDQIIGAVRHVDDYYIGLRSEHEGFSVLSRLREIVGKYELNLNDSKTKIFSSMEPINDLWAQRLRSHMKFRERGKSPFLLEDYSIALIERAISEAVDTSKSVGSDSPIKLLLRSFDQEEIYNEDVWEYVEENLQRIVQKYPHAIDYACLLVAKRKAIKKTFDKDGWLAVGTQVINSSLSLNHHHEVVWMLWLLLVLDIELPSDLVDNISTSENSHIRAMLVQAFADKKIARKPSFRLGDSLSTEDETWLLSLVAKASGFSKAKFSGAYANEFKHLADKNIVLIDFNSHIKKVAKGSKHAISRTRYGYDDIDGDDEYDDDDDDDDGATRQATPLNPLDPDFLDGIKF